MCWEQHQEPGRREKVTRDRDLMGDCSVFTNQQVGAAFYPCKCSLHMSCLFLLEEVFPATVIHNTHRGLEGGWQQPAQLQTGHFKASVVSPASVTAPPQ